MNGFLSLYLDDGENVFRLLPYDDMAYLNTVPVTADKPYLFFSPNKEYNYFGNRVDELILFTPKKNEMNTLHVLFSEKEYFKPSLDSNYKDEEGKIVPKSLTKKEFENWLADNKTAIDDFIDAQVNIEILGKN